MTGIKDVFRVRIFASVFVFCFLFAAGFVSFLVGCGDGDDDLVVTPVEYSDWPAARELHSATAPFPAWTFGMRLWPFDVLTPEMTPSQIEEQLDVAVAARANAVIFYVESEHMYRTFVDEAGFAEIRLSIEHLTAEAVQRGLRTIVYVNGLEVMTRGAYDAGCNPTGIPTMATEHPEWLQVDLAGEPLVYVCQDAAWLEPDWEDAWLSPFSGYRDLFKTRIAQLADAGVDGVYIDATFLPGYQADENNLRWGSADAGFADAFLQAKGLAIPEEADFNQSDFRAFLSFRHEALADYLADLGATAWSSGLVPFWESSTNDTPESTLLGNETAVTGREGLGFSPEIEPEGDWLAAFRMAKVARELNQECPMIYLGWPESIEDARVEFAVALAHSNTYYPTADIEVPQDAFPLMDRLQTVLEQRIPYGGDLALVYSVRNKDNTHEDGAFFDAYVDVFEDLTREHIPFRIAPLEYLTEDGLDGVAVVILPDLRGLSDDEVAILDTRRVISVSDSPADGVGTRDESWTPREQAVAFAETANRDAVTASLPFGITAPSDTFIEYYGNRDGSDQMFLFAVSPVAEGEIILTARPGTSLNVTVDGLDRPTNNFSGDEISVSIDSQLVVLDVREES